VIFGRVQAIVLYNKIGMIDKYEEHNRRVLDNCKPYDFVVVMHEKWYDHAEAMGELHLLDKVVISRPLKALVQYPRVRQGYVGPFGGYKKYKFKKK
jgi:hypothetical protein